MAVWVSLRLLVYAFRWPVCGDGVEALTLTRRREEWSTDSLRCDVSMFGASGYCPFNRNADCSFLCIAFDLFAHRLFDKCGLWRANGTISIHML